MHIHTFSNEAGREFYILFGEDEEVIDLPSRFAYSKARQLKYSKRTIVEYLKILKLFCQYLHTESSGPGYSVDEALATVRAWTVEDWLVELRSRGLSSNTLRKRDVVLKMFMEWLTTQEAGQVRSTLEHPYADQRLKTPTPRRAAPKYLTYQEVATFIQQGFHNESERCLIHFLFETGLRVSEVPRVRRMDLPDPAAYPTGTMYFPLLVRGSKGRGGNIREYYTIISLPMLQRLFKLHSNWRVYLRAQAKHKPNEMPAFLNVRGEPITSGAIQKQVRTATCRLHKTGVLLKHVSPHSFRHSTAFSVLQSEHGRNLQENQVICQRILGHRSLKSTEHYTMIPAAVLVQLQFFNSSSDSRQRFEEAQYIYEHSFKPFRAHTERRGHGRRSLYLPKQ
jgi:integrase/recombinase XerD